MNRDTLVSVIIIFFNAEKFIEEAVESVLAQSYRHWELLLIDDGSSDASTQIAKGYTARHPRQIIYVEHSGHKNRGKGASRNLGLRRARGEYIAFLDADDVWLPQKLKEQVSILDLQPEVGMLYGNTLYWHSWTHNSGETRKDFIPPLGVQPNILIEPPKLLPLYLRGKAAVPCTCSILLRRSTIFEIGGFDESFVGESNIYEDQAFYAKVCLRAPVYVVDKCWDWYRQHAGASVAVAHKSRQEATARMFFLNWLGTYLNDHGVKDIEVRQALRRELWCIHHPAWLPPFEGVRDCVRWTKKWILRFEERLLPAKIRNRLWV